MLVERESGRVVLENASDVKILKLNSGGEPLAWIGYQESVYHEYLGKVLWTIEGSQQVFLRGGTNSATGERSEMRIDTIIAVDSNVSPTKYRSIAPALSNRDLFERDRNLCAYCGDQFTAAKLTRDHIMPRSRGGPDVWENVVASCRACNQKKDDRTPSEAKMELLFIPYVPSYNEKLILSNRKILADQMDFLIKGVGRNSRLLENVEKGRLLK